VTISFSRSTLLHWWVSWSVGLFILPSVSWLVNQSHSFG